MKNAAGTAHGVFEQTGIAYVTLDDFEIDPFDVSAITTPANKCANGKSFVEKAASYRRADEARSAG
jgi:hypothetical protein